MQYYTSSKKEVFRDFSSSKDGLSDKLVSSNRNKYGQNILQEKKPISAFKIFISQFNSLIVWILIAALVISIVIATYGHEQNAEGYIDAIVIGIILILNAILGFIQEFKAEKSIEALKKLTALKSKVRRNGKIIEVDVKELVPGDILILEAGDKVGADAFLIEMVELQAQESALTGESTPVSKSMNKITKKVPVAEQKNMVFSGTVITRGRAEAVVVQTGMKSQIGKIAEMLEEQNVNETPLQIQLDKFGKSIGILTLIICALVLAAGYLKGGEFSDMFITAVSLAVAAIPEGLPAVVTISLAFGIKRMIKRNSLIRKLPSVETLGSTSVICSDKTGTLTHNQMTVVKMFANNKEIEVTGKGYVPKGSFSRPIKEFKRLLEIGALCNDASLSGNSIIGDPTEGALVVSAAKANIKKSIVEKIYKRVKEIPFDSERKLMTTVHKIKGKNYAYVKGAPDQILKKCKKIEINGKVIPLKEHEKILLLHQNDKFAESALRVLGFAYKEVKGKLTEDNLIFVGLQAMIDPAREEVKDAIKKCHSAGVKVVMITGDHITTAKAIAQQLGIVGKAITGDQLEKLKDLNKQVEHIAVYARVNPEHKLRIVGALQKNRHVVAMTGDGVNDAPALKKADIGIAMGITGTDVAKEASEMILTDDNFASIVSAVEEGRGIYANIKRFVYYLLSSNMGEVLTIFLAILIGFTGPDGELVIPLLAAQLLWMNLVTDGLPALALGVNPPEKDVMCRPPRDIKEKILSTYPMMQIFFIGIVMMVGTLYVFNQYSPSTNPDYARTMAFTTLMMFQMFNVLNYASVGKSFFSFETFRNHWLIIAIFSSIFLQTLVIYTPLMNTLFRTIPITIADWGYIIMVSFSVILIGEVLKMISRIRQPHS
jgi:P-type Ca2+ transporter type 2C